MKTRKVTPAMKAVFSQIQDLAHPTNSEDVYVNLTGIYTLTKSVLDLHEETLSKLK